VSEKDITRLAGEIVVACYQHGGAVPWGVDRVATLAVLQARALAAALAKSDADLTRPAPVAA
jgi:hypothetical protein